MGGNILELIKQNPVEWKALGEVVVLERGKQLNKNLLSENGHYPAYNGGVSYSGFTDNYNYNENTIIISQGGASAGFINFVTSKFYANAHCYAVLPKTERVENRYVYHFLKLNQETLTNKQHGAGIPALRTSEILDIRIPIPPLSIQTEIARILDTFTALTAELTAELSTRQQQYNYYRDLLLSEAELQKVGFEWKALGEVCSVGVGQPPSLTEIGNYAFVNAGTAPSGFLSAYNTEPDTVTTPSRGQGGIGYVGYQSDYFWCGPLCYRIKSINAKVSTKFIYHIMVSRTIDIIGLANMTGVPALNRKELIQFLVPIPPLTEQTRIVAILDKFDTLTTSISEGLPREIKLRQQQYEYYRDLLLSFSKTEVDTLSKFRIN